MIRVSRSAIVTRKLCEMRRYRNYEFRGSGISPKDFTETEPNVIGLSALPKVRGAIFHNLSLAIVEGAERKDWVEVLKRESQVLPEGIRKLQSTLIRRAMIGWELIRGPYWRQEFDVISAEEEWTWQITPEVVQPLRLDKILRRKYDGCLGILDYKTMGNVDPNWMRRMEISDQTHTYIQALKERSGEWILGMCYDGVIIGKFKNGEQQSPFVQGYEKNGKISPKWSAGSHSVDLTDYNDDKWLEWIHDKAKVLKDLYCTTEFINPPAQRLLHTKHSIGRAEEEWGDRIGHVETIRATFGEDSHEYDLAMGLIEKNPDACFKYGVGNACPFVAQCWQGMPVDDDDFEPRKDHHEVEENE